MPPLNETLPEPSNWAPGAGMGEICTSILFILVDFIIMMSLSHDTYTGIVVTETRKRKGLKEGIPDLSNYLDKL